MVNHSCCNKQKVKRGLWSPEEDEKLIKYISNYGHGCWSTVPRLAGLQRCGKSCRLRWINYLRPDLKRGIFSTQEAALIIELHRILGNRWAQIAKHLPGRTDNEVKNFWNSSIKKKMIENQNLSDFTSALISQNLPNSICNTNMINTSISCENFYFLNPNNNLMIPNSQIDQIPIPNPPLISQDFDPSEFRVLDQVMNYTANLVSTPPPTNIHLISSSAYDHPLGYNYHPQFIDNHEQILLKQEDNFIFSSDNPSSTLFHDRFLINPTPEIIDRGCDQDSSMVPILPKLSKILKWNEQFGTPFSSCSQEQVVESILGISASGFSTSENYACAMHEPRNHIIEPIMELFAPSSSPASNSSSSSSACSSAASSPPASLLSPPPSSGTFLLNPNLPACWGPLP